MCAVIIRTPFGWFPQKKRRGPNLNPPTAKQVIQRERFAMVNAFAGKVNDAVKIGYDKCVKNKTAANVFVSEVLQWAVSNQDSLWKIDYSKVFMSRGTRCEVYKKHLITSDDGCFTFIWGVHDDIFYFNRIYLVVYNETRDTACHQMTEVKCDMDLKTKIDIPDFSKDDRLHAWVFVIYDKGRRRSCSRYLSLQYQADNLGEQIL